MTAMIEPKLEVLPNCARWPKKNHRSGGKAFGIFSMLQANRWHRFRARTEISRQALSFTEQNRRLRRSRAKAGSRHRSSGSHANSIGVLKSQFTNAGEHMRQITSEVMSAAKDAFEGVSRDGRPYPSVIERINGRYLDIAK